MQRRFEDNVALVVGGSRGIGAATCRRLAAEGAVVWVGWREHEEAAADVVVLAYGVPALTAIEAADRLGSELAVEVWDARFAKPVDGDLIERTLRSGTPILTIEEHSLIGGFGSAVIDEAVARGLDASLIERAGLPDRWIHTGSRGEQLAEAGLDVDGLTKSIRAAAGRVKSPAPPMVELPKRTSTVQ